MMPMGPVIDEHRYWGVMWVDDVDAGNWKLLSQSITPTIVSSIEKSEDAYDATWGKMQKEGFYLVRLRLMPDGQPADIAFAWTEKVSPAATGVMSYIDYAKMVRGEHGMVETRPITR